MSQNSAAWITAPRAKPLEIKEAPLWKAGPGEIVVKNAAVAIVSLVDYASNGFALTWFLTEPGRVEDPVSAVLTRSCGWKLTKLAEIRSSSL